MTPGPGSGWETCADCGGSVELHDDGQWRHVFPADSHRCAHTRPQPEILPRLEMEAES